MLRVYFSPRSSLMFPLHRDFQQENGRMEPLIRAAFPRFTIQIRAKLNSAICVTAIKKAAKAAAVEFPIRIRVWLQPYRKGSRN